ncbi:MAG: hypothetical protein ACLUIR_02475 [Faecalibacterium prausnitzii]
MPVYDVGKYLSKCLDSLWPRRGGILRSSWWTTAHGRQLDIMQDYAARRMWKLAKRIQKRT